MIDAAAIRQSRDAPGRLQLSFLELGSGTAARLAHSLPTASSRNVMERPRRIAERQRSKHRAPNARHTTSGFFRTSELVITPRMIPARCTFRATFRAPLDA